MFVFLSKLLPLLIYPLGLSCLLMMAALITLWRRPKWVAAPIAAALIILMLGSSGSVSKSLVRSLEWQNLPTAELPQASAIIVLGGGVKAALPPRPWVELGEAGDRIIYASRLYRQGKAPLLVLSGGRVDWKGGGSPESADMAEIAQTIGVPAAAILQEPDSHNTYQNAVNVRKILEDKGIKGSVLLVTSAMHMTRSLLIFHHQGIQAIAAPTDFQITQQDIAASQNNWQAFALDLLPDTYYLHQSTKALKEYIGLIVYRLRGWL
ncbi:YdcF family protein [Microcoleus sp. LEGE 07076]|uniref:YdcF family protein n=1 Tax=Microcoleus sp. LEGE 07076 TaxID=915322 RepID=UPI001880BA1E|nr:YdcF family protein [Microcoleus sp. LEGE 07076]MBE9184125.1 YdcF family protein [Microcoleus sp. LEGE 07076]